VLTNPPQLPPPQEEAVDTPEDRSEPTLPPADTPVIPDEMETIQIHEEEAARGNHPHRWTLLLETPPVVVESPVAAALPVQLERSQCTRAPPSYSRDFLCDLVNMHSIL